MRYTTILSTTELAVHLTDPDWAIIDCRFALADTGKGRKDYLQAHIPGALYAHLDEHLSGPIISGRTGRHPLPTVERFAETLSVWGIDERVQVVVYDDAGGVYAGRLWWMLRWLGHDAVAVLDGDWRAWQREQRPTVSGAQNRPYRTFTPAVRPQVQVDADDVLANLHNPARKLFDARSADRYRGENEMIDARAGHIPGAFSAFYGPNLTAEGYFQKPQTLYKRFSALLGETPASDCVMYCGSGVSAVHNLLAMEIAGLSGARLYIGSWSHWITDTNRPVMTGDGVNADIMTGEVA